MNNPGGIDQMIWQVILGCVSIISLSFLLKKKKSDEKKAAEEVRKIIHRDKKQAALRKIAEHLAQNDPNVVQLSQQRNAKAKHQGKHTNRGKEVLEMNPWDEDYYGGPGIFPDDGREDEIYQSLRRSRAMDDLFGNESGRGFLGDMAADHQLSHDIASGMSVREALDRQRGMDYLIGDRRSNGLLSDIVTDHLIARDVERGMDIGEAISREQAWANFWDDVFNGK